MSELNFQSISNETTSFCNIAAENDLKIIDETSLSFLKLCLYKNIKLEPNSIHKLFENYFLILSKNISILFSFILFRKKFLELMRFEIDAVRNKWLLSNSNLNEIETLETKKYKNYFKELENKKILELISNIDSVQKLVLNEYRIYRLNFAFNYLKKNIGFILFWAFIIVFLLLSFIFAANDNSFTLGQQIQIWIHFILGKN